MTGTGSFGPFVFDSATGTLSRSGRPISIGGRGAALLSALVDADGGAVGKDALIEAAWPGTIVEEGNLSVQIATLRKALGRRPDGQEWIATVPRVGYRLLKASLPSPDLAASVLPSLAVLPFGNLSGDAEQEYFADGVVEDIITALSRFRSFAVIARNSSFVYKGRAVDVRQVSKELGVRYVLEGSVRRGGERLRITAQLVDGQTGAHLWAEHFDGAVGEVFEFQDRIAERVVGVVEPQILWAEVSRSRRERPDSIEAYDLYLRALARHYRLTAEDNAAAQVLAEQAINLDPSNTVYLALMANLMEFRSAMGLPPLRPDDKERCRDFVERALATAGDDATALGLCGIALLQYLKEYDRGMTIIDRAIRLNPNNFVVLLCASIGKLHCGDLVESIAHSEHAIRLSPGDAGAHWALTAIAHAHMVFGDYETALSWAERSLGMNANFAATYWMLIAANAHLGRIDTALRYLAELDRVSPGATLSSIKAGQPQKDPARTQAILEGLRLAGLPET